MTERPKHIRSEPRVHALLESSQAGFIVSSNHKNLSAYWYQLVDVCVFKHAWACLNTYHTCQDASFAGQDTLDGEVFVCHVSNV